MTGNANWRDELEKILAGFQADGIDSAQQALLNKILREHDEALDIVAESLELDAMLYWHHGQVESSSNREPKTAPIRQIWRWSRLASLAVAALLVALVIEWLAISSTTAPVVAPGPKLTRITVGDDWLVEHSGDVELQVLSSHQLHLARGELFVRSLRAPASDLTIETPDGTVRAHGTEFFVGSHERKRDNETMNRLTRVLVLSGTVTLTNALGTASAAARELLIAPQDKPPQKLVAEANNAFGLDLLKSLAESHDGNLFFSPYSISVAMAMTLEGARAQTADEIARVLHLPAAFRRIGDLDQRLPFALAELHTGHAELAKMFREALSSPVQRELRTRLQANEAKVTDLKRRIAALVAKDDYSRVNQLRTELASLHRDGAKLWGQQKTYRLSIANAMFGEKTYPFAPAFRQTIAQAYGTGAIVECDFQQQPDLERLRINDWVNQQTQGRIHDLIGPGLVDKGTRLALINAIYFKANWMEPFDPSLTHKEVFALPDQTSVEVDMMFDHQLKRARYAAFRADGSPFVTPEMKSDGQVEGLYPGQDGFQLLELPYQGGDLSMIILLPRRADGLPALERELTSSKLSRWIKALKSRDVGVMLPRFKAESSISLVETLQSLGVRRAFKDPRYDGGAQFAGMTSSQQKETLVRISAIAHRACIEVDEKGSEAAAATAVIATLAGSVHQSVMPFTPQVLAKHPFLYAIRDVHTGTIMFLGRLADPR